MRRVGEDLRDGPMRQVGLVLLKLDALRGQPPADDVDAIGSALNQTLIQMRSLTASLLPSRIWRLSLQDTIATAARRHERRTGVPVTCRFGPLLSNVPISVKACLYRFVQDGLNYCCISCDSCMVRMSSKSGEIEVEIIACGSAMPRPSLRAEHEQALSDLRDRVETLGGTFLVQAHSNFRSVAARLKLEETNPADD
jgi:signal transduction histidine kinase